MSKIIILGSGGHLGQKLTDHFSANHTIFPVARKINRQNLVRPLVCDLCDVQKLQNLIEHIEPDYIINAAIIKKFTHGSKSHSFWAVNSILPKCLTFWASDRCKVVNISSDAVFSGKKGNYLEEDLCDPICSYGISKFLGEQTEKNFLNLRVSFLGLSQNTTNSSFLDWVFSPKTRTLEGYGNYIFSPVSVKYLIDCIEKLIGMDIWNENIMHIYGDSLSKVSLARLLLKEFHFKKKVYNNNKIVINRSLLSSKPDYGLYQPLSEMLADISEEFTKSVYFDS